jgi:hypothetical protein
MAAAPHPLEDFIIRAATSFGGPDPAMVSRASSCLGGFPSGAAAASASGGPAEGALHELCLLLSWLLADPALTSCVAAERVLDYAVGYLTWRPQPGAPATAARAWLWWAR